MLGKSLRNRALLIVLGCLVGLAALAWYLFAVLTHEQFLEIERQQVSESVRRVQAAFESEADDLKVRAEDWAYWDDAIEFVNSGDENFSTNFTRETLDVVDVDVAIFANKLGETKLVLESLPSFRVSTNLSPSLLPVGGITLPYVKSALNKVPTTVVTELEDQPVLLAVVPILNSQGDGDPQGYLVVGRSIDKDFLNSLRRRTRMSIQLWPFAQADSELRSIIQHADPGSPVLRSQTDNTINGYGVINDFRENAAIVFRVDESRPIYQQSIRNSHKGILFFLSGALVVGISMMWLLKSAVISGIVDLSNEMKSVRELRDISKRIHVRGVEEIEQLADSANFMLASLEAAQIEIRQGRDLLHEQATKFAEQVEKLSRSQERAGNRQNDLRRLSATTLLEIENSTLKTLETLKRLSANGNSTPQIEAELTDSIRSILKVCDESKRTLREGQIPQFSE